ncbi:MAG TPA: Rieske (2Fe-2S) protein [Candidatus Eisenbacteria bacterium]|nr:Rieske (2Fe-2S) protein [Candidatus Eisenbacteria bacterium]
MPSRHRIGTLSEIPEDEGKRVEFGGLRIAVFRRGERVYAVGDSCPHMGASLSDGYIDGRTVICPWHGWMFDLETGASPFDEDARIPVFRVRVENGDVFLEIEEGSLPSCRTDCRSGEQ